jgi:glutamyl-tRNA reductase
MTKLFNAHFIFAREMKSFHCIAFTHHNVGIDSIGKYHISEDGQQNRLSPLPSLGLQEFVFISTCNRVELWFRTEVELSNEFLQSILASLYPNFDPKQVELSSSEALVYSHFEAVDHVLRVASSLNSLVIGEREILTQVRKSYERCSQYGFCGDFLRILMRKTIEIAKRVYTETAIATNPVSVVNLAYLEMQNVLNFNNPRVVFIGAGKTNHAMARKLQKAGYSNFHVFNRTKSRAKEFSEQYGGKLYSLTELQNFDQGFDLLVSCTGSETNMVTPELYHKLRKGETSEKVIIDLAVPNDIAQEIQQDNMVSYISVSKLERIAAENLEKRKGEIDKCESIIKAGLEEFEALHKVRKVELAMRKVPQQVKDIRQRATEVVFAQEIANLDAQAKETLDKVISFMEKKYMSTPMLLAKEILLKDEIKE